MTQQPIAEALGVDRTTVAYSSPTVTRRYYDHFVRRSFSEKLRQGLGLGRVGEAPVLPLRRQSS